jgi:tetratricopeptide (TPR) repeat protein
MGSQCQYVMIADDFNTFKNGGITSTSTATFYSAWTPWQPRAGFWSHGIWAKHPDTKEYAMAGLTGDDSFEAKSLRYRTAYQAEPEKPVISFLLSSLYLRQSDPRDALPWAEKATRLCRDGKADEDCLAKCLLLEADIYNALGSRDTALGKYSQAVELGNTTALDLLASHYAGMGNTRSLSRWLELYLKCKDGGRDSPGNTFANAVLRQPVFSEWHSTFSKAVMELKQPALHIKAYIQAIRLARAKRGSILTQCGCRFHLARALARWPSQRAKAIPLWTWILNNLTRFRNFLGGRDGTWNRLFVLTMEELSLSQALSLDHPLVLFAENIDLSIFDYSRVLILLGKGIEQQRHMSEVAAQLYRRVLRRVLNMSRLAGLTDPNKTALGNILVALGHLDDAARALSWACMYANADHEDDNEDDEKDPFDSDESSTSEDKKKRVSLQTAAKGKGKPQSLQMRISWDVLCDMCMAKTSYSASIYIFGYRYKCCVCSEVDLCEPCYVAWNNSSDKKMHEGLRHCEAGHKFLKLPTLMWPEVEWEAKRIRAGQTPKSVRAWLEELVVKYDLQDHRYR